MIALLGIDPGSEKSGVLRYEILTRCVTPIGILPNCQVLDRLRYLRETRDPEDVLVVEDTKAYTLPRKSGAGRFFPEQVRLATFAAGRFVECWGGPYALMDRRRVKQLLTGQTTVGDPEIWEALLDRFGGTRKRAVGVKAKPGPLYGVTADLRAALAVCLAYVEELSIPHSLNCRGGPGGYGAPPVAKPAD
jgi:hypothetical protein